MEDKRIELLVQIVKDLAKAVQGTHDICAGLQKQISLQQEQINVLKQKL